jgi:glycosyltransferase involved in cell wall biosynthesis
VQTMPLDARNFPTNLDEAPLPVNLPPVVITAFTRPDLLQPVLDSIAQQTLSPQEIIAFLDGPRHAKDEALIEQCVELLQAFETSDRTVQIIRWPQNLGCDQNVIAAFTKVFETHETLVYIEDDDWVNPCFYDRMCRLLELYKDCPQIFSVSGYASLAMPREEIETDFFLSRRVFSWGFGIWRDRWQAMDLLHQSGQYNPFDQFYRLPTTVESKMTLVNQFWLEKNYQTDWVITMTVYALSQNKFHLVPKHSIVKNIGFGHEQSETYRGKEAAWVNSGYDEAFIPKTLPEQLTLHNQLSRELTGVELAQFLGRKNIWLTPAALIHYLLKYPDSESWYHFTALFFKRLPTLWGRWKSRSKV